MQDKRIIQNNHNRLTTYALLSDFTKHIIHDWIEQLTGQDYIKKTGKYNVLNVTEKGWSLLKGNQTPRLLKPAKTKAKVAKVTADSWEGVDRDLFEALRKLRTAIAAKKSVPAYVVFGDASLRDIARRKPVTLDDFLEVKGVGQKKCKQYDPP